MRNDGTPTEPGWYHYRDDGSAPGVPSDLPQGDWVLKVAYGRDLGPGTATQRPDVLFVVQNASYCSPLEVWLRYRVGCQWQRVKPPEASDGD